MIPAISNIALSAYDHADELPHIAALGYRGLEVAPSRVWHDTWKGLAASDVEAYRRLVEGAGLSILGLHSLVFDHPECQLFGDADARTATMEFMVHLSGVCRDLGGRTLIWGGGRNRGAVARPDAVKIAVAFMQTLTERTADHGTCFCFEALGPSGSDFINSTDEALSIMRAVDHPGLRMHLDVKAMVENDDVHDEVVDRALPYLEHVHVNADGLGVLTADAGIDHARIGKMLAERGYRRYITAEQRMLDAADPLAAAAQSFSILDEYYVSPCQGI
jgi:sugar phosphate isomerase/epimerase